MIVPFESKLGESKVSIKCANQIKISGARRDGRCWRLVALTAMKQFTHHRKVHDKKGLDFSAERT
jgi:hypothetical protein